MASFKPLECTRRELDIFAIRYWSIANENKRINKYWVVRATLLGLPVRSYGWDLCRLDYAAYRGRLC